MLSEGRICGAVTRHDSHPCKNAPMAGQQRCRMHGGAAPQARRRGAERVAEVQAMAAITKLGITPVESPIRELAKLAGEAVHMREFLLRRVTSGEVSGAEAGAYERWLDRCAAVLTALARLGLEERQVRLAERETAIVVGAMTIFVQLMGQDVSEPIVRNRIVTALTEARDRYEVTT